MITELQLEYANMALLWPINKIGKKLANSIANGLDRALNKVSGDPKEYLEKIQQSKLVFNTPAFWDCHGWKLGEYMALGKCIISTPISNELPTPIEYSDKTDKAWMSEYFYIVDKNKQSMKDAIEYLKNNSQHREMMESRVAKYWENNGTPIASLKRLGIKC